MSFKCVLVTPEQQLLDETIEQAIVPTWDGLTGILTDRAPLLVKLGIGPLRVDLSGGSKTFLIEGGVAQMKENVLTILTPMATPSDEIKAEEGRAEMPRAVAMPISDEASFEARQNAMQRARMKQTMGK